MLKVERNFAQGRICDIKLLVDFADFLAFAASFGKTAVTFNGQPVGGQVTKPVVEGE